MTRVQGCCCFPLKTGSLIIASLGCIGAMMKLFGGAGSAGNNQPQEYQDQYKQIQEWVAATHGYRIGYAVVALICCISLVVGINKKSPNYFIPWMIFSCIEAVLMTIATVVCFVCIFVFEHPYGVVFGILFAMLLFSSALAWYFWIVVYSHYQEVKSGVVNVVTGTGGNVYYSPTSTNPPAYDKDGTQMA